MGEEVKKKRKKGGSDEGKKRVEKTVCEREGVREKIK